MDFVKRAEDSSDIKGFERSDRFVETESGYYFRTREGIEGPYVDLAAALNGLMQCAQKNGMTRYQMRQLYESICEKALSSC